MSTTITKEAITKACPTVKNLDLVLPQLQELCPKYKIDTKARIAMFIAQCLHESGQFKYFKEIWGPTTWQQKYEGHVKLWNLVPGDGKLFMGRGLIQLTGRKNYTKFAVWADDAQIIINPAIVAEPKYAVLSAIYYWVDNNLNRFADNNDIDGCTKAVNGSAMLGKEERKHYYLKLLENII